MHQRTFRGDSNQTSIWTPKIFLVNDLEGHSDWCSKISALVPGLILVSPLIFFLPYLLLKRPFSRDLIRPTSKLIKFFCSWRCPFIRKQYLFVWKITHMYVDIDLCPHLEGERLILNAYCKFRICVMLKFYTKIAYFTKLNRKLTQKPDPNPLQNHHKQIFQLHGHPRDYYCNYIQIWNEFFGGY